MPTPENLAAREWFQNARFGWFIHWGVYSILGGGEEGLAEWIKYAKRIPKDQYDKLPAFFNPVEFNAKEWVALAKAAGMKYITSKHHDGFAMYNSKVSDYDVVDRTPYQKDVLKQLAEECEKQGLRLFFYYSQLDWHHPDYFPLGHTGTVFDDKPKKGDWNQYLAYQHAQLSELLTNYGKVGGIRFDGWWDRQDLPNADWRLEKTYQLIHQLQPAALIGNHHHQPPFPGEDFQMFEKDLPGENAAGYSGQSKVGKLPLQTCETMNISWGFNLKDNKYKSTKNLIHYPVKAAGYNSNFLLNIGPMPNGKVQPEFVSRLQEIGKWMDKNGETIYSTRQGPVSPRNWGVTTAKANKVYVHILDWQDPTLALPSISQKIKQARLYQDKSPVKYSQTAQGIVLVLPKASPAEVDRIIELEVE